MTDAANEILGKERHRKKPWVTRDVLDLCDERRNLKKKRYEAEGAKEYREANKRIQKAVKKAKEDWIGAHAVQGDSFKFFTIISRMSKIKNVGEKQFSLTLRIFQKLAGMGCCCQ